MNLVTSACTSNFSKDFFNKMYIRQNYIPYEIHHTDLGGRSVLH